MEPGLSASRYGDLAWVAKLDIASFFDAIPHGPLLAALSLARANMFLSAFDRALERAGIVFLRYLDDVTILAASRQPSAPDREVRNVQPRQRAELGHSELIFKQMRWVVHTVRT